MSQKFKSSFLVEGNEEGNKLFWFKFPVVGQIFAGSADKSGKSRTNMVNGIVKGRYDDGI